MTDEPEFNGPLPPEPADPAEAITRLEDLLSGKDRLLTSGEVAEVLNVNVNTLYLWRASGEVDLPFQRFISPGQSRGMIRYKYSDVVKFLEAARLRGQQEDREHADPNREHIKVVITDREELETVQARLKREAEAAARKKQAHSKRKKDALAGKPLKELLQYQPQFVPEPAEAPAEPAPTPAATTPEEAARMAKQAADIMAQFEQLIHPPKAS